MSQVSSNTRSLIHSFEAFAADRTGVLFIESAFLDGTGANLTRSQIIELCRALSEAFRDAGVRPGDRVIIAIRNSIEQWASFWGIQLLGAIAAFVPPIESDHAFAARYDQLSGLAAKIGARMIVVPLGFGLSDRVRQLCQALPSLGFLSIDGQKSGIANYVNHSDFAVIQFTSGSTDFPKGCALSGGGFVRNARRVAERLNSREGDSIVSWLPTFHDMGLLVGLILPVIADMSVCFRPTNRFLMNPLSWLTDIGSGRSTHTGVPNFALALVLQRLERKPCYEIDLRNVCNIVCGAEPIDANLARRFLQELSRFGIKQSSFHSAYGMAEATLMVTSRPAGLAASTVSNARSRNPADALPRMDAGLEQQYVNLGHPIPGVSIKVVDDRDTFVDDGLIGRILIQSDCMMLGYIGNKSTLNQIDSLGWFDTGDLGFLSDGQLYVTGRSKDLIIVSGKNVYPAVIEFAVSNALGVESHKVAAFGRESALGTEEICIVVEHRRGSISEFDDSLIVQACMEATGFAPAIVFHTPSGSIPRTTSGKVRRSDLRSITSAGELPMLPRLTETQRPRVGT